MADDALLGETAGEASASVRLRVSAARDRQRARQNKANADLDPGDIAQWCPLDREGADLLKQALSRLNLSARAYHRILKVARTLADLAGSEEIVMQHIAEAIRYRRGLTA